MLHRLSPARSNLRLAVLLVVLGMLASGLLGGGFAGTARADALPPLPLPDCVANGLVPDNFTDCEGSLATYANLPAIPRPAQGEVALGISTRAVDFRLDADRSGNGQLVTFSFTFPGEKQAPGPEGSTYRSKVTVNNWPAQLEAFQGIQMSCRLVTDALWGTGCDGEPVGSGPSPNHVSLVRQGTCEIADTSCTYRVTWGPYDRRVREAMLFRIRLDWVVTYTRQLQNGMFDSACAFDLTHGGCQFGGGASYVTYGTTPPPPLNAIGTARRLGAKEFEFDGSASNPDVASREWSVQVPDLSTSSTRFITSPAPVFTLDFGAEPNIPASFFQSVHVATLKVTDRWNRTKFAFAEYSFLEPAGTEGPLEITSFVLVGVDQDGVATLKAVVKNTSTGPLTDVYLFSQEGLGLISPLSSPQAVTLAADETAEFTVTLQFDARDELTVQVKAFGTSDSGPIKSTPKSKQFNRDGGLVGSTTVSQPSQPGDHKLQVASNDGFQPGQYAAINLNGDNVEVRPIAALGSLIFDAPLAKAHAVGEPVKVIQNTAATGDVVGPTIDVTAPAAGAFVCQGTALAAAFTCSDPDPSAGIEICGEAVENGQALDTTVAGAKQTTIRAWDHFGNVTEKTVAWTVGLCASEIDSFRCYQAKPAAGSAKFAPVLGVRVNGSFDDVLVDLKKPLQLCAPADTTADGLVDADTHLEAYAIKVQKGQPKPAPHTGRQVLSQLGSLVVDTGKPAQLLLPTAEDPASSPSLTVNELDRFACYQAKLAKGQPKLPKDLQLTIGDQFTSPPKRVTVKKLVRLCTPVGVNGGATKHTANLLCFQVATTKGRCAEASPTNAGGGCKKETDCGGTKGQTTLCALQAKFLQQPGRNVVNDLDAGKLDAAKEDVLCLPALLAP